MIIEHISSKINKHIKYVPSISEEDIWTTHCGTLIWKAEGFQGTPHFYPVYKWGNYYSYSLLALLVKKGNLKIAQEAVNYINQPCFMYLPVSLNIDQDIERIGAPHHSGSSITKSTEYAERLAAALTLDIQRIENKNSGYKNYILCGGKDSLNLLLLPWKGEVIALSAEPNFPLVKKFVADNGLDIEVQFLEDKLDEQELHDEVLECCCRVDMVHWRWGAHLKDISQQNNGKLIFWKGQMADLYTSDKWKVYMHPEHPVQMFAHKVYRKLEPITPFVIKQAIGRRIQPIAVQAAWDRGAVMQGTHLAFIRAIANCLVLSAYHGPEVMKVWQEVDLATAAQKDMRNLVGEILLGRPVIYPESNPAPAPSIIREQLVSLDNFAAALQKNGITIENP